MDIPLGERLLRLQKWGGPQDGEDVLGDAVPYANCYISAYPEVRVGQGDETHPWKPVKELAVGEFTVADFRLCSTHGVYKIVRVK